MIIQVLTLLAASVPTLAQPFQYPPGLTPAMCPNYPYCNPFHEVEAAPTMMAYNRRSDYPANLNPATCPNYPYCNTEMGARGSGVFNARLYPANMNPRSCPDYPFCSIPQAPVPADVDPASCPNYPYCPIFTYYGNE